MKNPFQRFDDFFIELINRRMKHKLLNVFFYYYTHLCGVISLILFNLLMWIFSTGELRQVTYQMTLSLLVSTAIVHMLKRAFSRSRPYWILENLNTYGIDLKDYSFPSGHTTAAFSIATIFSLNYPAFALQCVILALLIDISRVYLAVHYPKDVLVGLIIGTVTSFLVYFRLYALVRRFI